MSAFQTKIFKKKMKKMKKLEAQMKITLVYMEAMNEAQKVEREIDEICSRIQIDPEHSIDHLIGKVPV